MSLEELALHNGEDAHYPLRLGLDGIIFNVDTTEGQRFYATDQSYHVFAGGDYTRALALGSLDPGDIDRRHDVSDFTLAQNQELLDRVQFYINKYEPVAMLEGSLRSRRRHV